MKFENIFNRLCNKIEFLLGIKKENKIISIEYFLGIIISFTLWSYYLIQTGIISQEYYHKCKRNMRIYIKI